MGLGIKLSTLGYGLEVATPLNNLFILRLGVNLTAGINVKEFNVAVPDEYGDLYDSFGYIPDLRVKPNPKFSHGNLLLDFHPSGIFHLTAGVFVGGSKLELSGHLVDHNNQPAKLLPGKDWPVVEVGDHEVDLTDGRTNLDLKLGSNILKPYLGFGFGRAVPKNNRLSFKFELGAFLQSGYTIRNDGVVLDFANSDQKELIDIHDFMSSYIKFWPMLNFQLSYRIF